MGTQALKSFTDSYHIICWWRSADCWASSTIMASSKNLLMLTSSLIPWNSRQTQTLLQLRCNFLVLHYCWNWMIDKISTDKFAWLCSIHLEIFLRLCCKRRNIMGRKINDKWQHTLHINHAAALLKKQYHSQAFCVCVYIYGLVSYSHRVLKPQLQSTPMNLQYKIIEGKEVLEQFSNSHSRTY